MAGKTAILIGATGLVGGHCLQLLLQSPRYERVIAVSRRPVPLKHKKLVRVETPFEQLGQALEKVQADDAFCCLGTTIRQAGTKAEFHKVDYGYALEFAHRVLRSGATHFLLVSALGAHARSPVFYNRVKGLLEKDVRIGRHIQSMPEGLARAMVAGAKHGVNFDDDIEGDVAL